MSAANAKLNGGPLDGQVHVVPRSYGRLPQELTAKGYARASRETDSDLLPIITHRYKLVADAGPTARYEYDGT